MKMVWCSEILLGEVFPTVHVSLKVIYLLYDFFIHLLTLLVNNFVSLILIDHINR